MAPPGGPGATRQTLLGPVYVDAKGFTLYTYDRDSPNISHCTGFCAEAWPPLTATNADQPKSDFTIITRSNGSKQWAYKGKPLYTYIQDSEPGDVTGDGDDNAWHVAEP